MKKALNAVFAVICGCFFLACSSQKEEIIEQNKKEIEQQKIALEEKKNEELKRNKQLQFEGIEIIVRLR